MAITERNQARLQALAAAVLFSTGGAGIKVESFNAAQVSMLRSGIAALVLFLWLRGRIDWNARTLLAGVVYSGTLSLFVAATKLTTAANAIFLQSTAPLYLFVLAPLMLHERVHRRDAVYLAAAGTGMVFCFLGKNEPSGTASDPVFGNWLAAASGLVWALTLLTLRRIGREDSDGYATVGAVVAGNAFACLAAAPFAWPLASAPAGEWMTVVYLGVFQIGLAYVCLGGAIRRLPALEVSLLLLLEPVLNPVWTWLIRGEAAGSWTILGGAVIITATAVKVVADSRAADRTVPPRSVLRPSR